MVDIRWYWLAWKRYKDFSGRSCREEYWHFALINGAILVLLSQLDKYFGSSLPFKSYTIFLLIHLFPSLGVGIRRLHDIGKSGWWLLLGFIPIIGPISLVFFLIQKGVPDPNKYGVPTNSFEPDSIPKVRPTRSQRSLNIMMLLVVLAVPISIAFWFVIIVLGVPVNERRETLNSFVNVLKFYDKPGRGIPKVTLPTVHQPCFLFIQTAKKRELLYQDNPEQMAKYKRLVLARLNRLQKGPDLLDRLLGAGDKELYFSDEEKKCLENYLSYLSDPARRQRAYPSTFGFLDKDGMPTSAPKDLQKFDCSKYKTGMKMVFDLIKNDTGKSAALKTQLKESAVKFEESFAQREKLTKEELLKYPDDPNVKAMAAQIEYDREKIKCDKEYMKDF